MRRITVSLPDELADVLERTARRRSQSASALTRTALRDCLGLGQEAGPRPLPFADLGSSDEPDLAQDMEDVLAREWAGDGPRRR